MYEIKMMAVAGNKPNLVGSIEIKLQDKVEKDQVLLTIETAKGKRTIKSGWSGVVTAIKVAVGDIVTTGQTLVEIEAEAEAEAPAVDAPAAENKQWIAKNAELLIIGGGPGGYVAAIYAAMQGKKVVLAEQANLGGTCLNEGCIPTKSFIESAELYDRLRHLSEFGLSADHVAYDFKQIADRKDRIVADLKNGIVSLLNSRGVEVLTGRAEFRDDRTVAVYGQGNYLLTCQQIIIATGARQAVLPIEGIDLDCVMTSREALALKKLPQSVTIIGGGVIGMEFAFIFRSFGVEVHVIEFMDSILSGIDPEASRLLREIAGRKGIQFSTAAKVESIKKAENNMAIVAYHKDGELHYTVSEKVLAAVGRVPNTEGLGLDKTGVEVVKGAVKTDQFLRTAVSHIYAIGDVTNIMQLAHVASHQAIAAVDHILGKNHIMPYDAVPAVIFTRPEIAAVGLSQADPDKHMVSRFDFAANGKALVKGETEGFVKLIKEKESGRIVGGVIIGPDASVMINTLTLAVKEKMSEQELSSMIFPHPTTGEALHEAAMGLSIGALHQ